MIIPREGDKVRFYIQLSEKDVVVDRVTGRVDKEKTKIGPEELLEVGRKSLSPYKIDKVGDFGWWTIYVSEYSYFLVGLETHFAEKPWHCQSAKEWRRNSL